MSHGNHQRAREFRPHRLTWLLVAKHVLPQVRIAAPWLFRRPDAVIEQKKVIAFSQFREYSGGQRNSKRDNGMRRCGMSLGTVNLAHAVNLRRMSKLTWERGSGVSGWLCAMPTTLCFWRSATSFGPLPAFCGA